MNIIRLGGTSPIAWNIAAVRLLLRSCCGVSAAGGVLGIVSLDQ